MSAMARARFSRPLPVWSLVPAASALRASRPTMTPFDTLGAAAIISAAAPATPAAAAEVPLIVAYPPPAEVDSMLSPGAARNVSVP